MTAEQTARRLGSAADELAGIKAELAAAADFGLDASGLGAAEVLGKLQTVWSRHTELAGRLSVEVSGLSVAVRAAAAGYREAEESSSARLLGEGGAVGVSGAAGVEGDVAASWGASGSAGVAGRLGGADGSAGVEGDVAASWGASVMGGASSAGGISGDAAKEDR